MSNPFLDKGFLLKLDQQKERENFARIISLDFDENPLEQIEGRVTGGSVNIDGTSAVRRSCSLSMVAENLDINNFYWGVKNKFKLVLLTSGKERKSKIGHGAIVYIINFFSEQLLVSIQTNDLINL